MRSEVPYGDTVLPDGFGVANGLLEFLSCSRFPTSAREPRLHVSVYGFEVVLDGLVLLSGVPEDGLIDPLEILDGFDLSDVGLCTKGASAPFLAE